jgi:6,7-dimethyl-8-ribityllumazine synthase
MAEIEKKGLELDGALDGSGMRVGIVHTRWNADVVNSLVSGAEDQLVRVSPLLLLLLVLVCCYCW